MCRFCDQIAPICPHVLLKNFADYCDGDDPDLADISRKFVTNWGKRRVGSKAKGGGQHGAKKALPTSAPPRLIMVRPGMTPSNPPMPPSTKIW